MNTQWEDCDANFQPYNNIYNANKVKVTKVENNNTIDDKSNKTNECDGKEVINNTAITEDDSEDIKEPFSEPIKETPTTQ